MNKAALKQQPRSPSLSVCTHLRQPLRGSSGKAAGLSHPGPGVSHAGAGRNPQVTLSGPLVGKMPHGSPGGGLTRGDMAASGRRGEGWLGGSLSCVLRTVRLLLCIIPLTIRYVNVLSKWRCLLSEQGETGLRGHWQCQLLSHAHASFLGQGME